MSDDKDGPHGPRVNMDSRTEQLWGDTPLDIGLPVRFWFVFPDGHRVRIPDEMVPARAWDRVATYMVEGPKGLEKPPSHPQPNDVVGKLLPPPSVDLDKKPE